MKKPQSISRNVDLNEFNNLGLHCFTVPLNQCKNIPSDQINNATGDWLLECIPNKINATVRTQILVIPQGNIYARYERTITNPWGGFNWGGGGTGTTPWKRVYFQGDMINTNITFAQAATSNIGESSKPANNCYLQNAVTVVSDERQKKSISELSEQELICSIACGKLYKKYKLNKAVDEKGDEARFHIGVISQDIVKCFNDHGLDWKQYGVVTYEKWDAIQAVEYQSATYDEKGDQLTPEIQAIEGRDGGEIYMVRYEELNCFINAGLDYRLSQLEK